LDLLQELTVVAAAYGIVALLAAAALPWLRPSGRPWLPLQRLRPGAWSGAEVFLLFLIYLTIQGLIVYLLDELFFFQAIFGHDVSLLRKFNVAAPLYACLILALHVSLLYWGSRTRAVHLGVSWARWRANAALGITGFVIAAPLVWLVHLAAINIWKHEPHDLEKLAGETLGIAEWGLLIVQAVALAPILEEWLFRGLLQGWLRRASLMGHFSLALVTLFVGSSPTTTALARSWEGAEVEIPWAPLVFASLLVAVYLVGIIRTWRPVLAHGLTHFVDGRPEHDPAPAEASLPLPTLHGPAWEGFKRRNARWAIFGSSMLFAVAHPWPSPVALVPLGLVLGWLAYRTQNLLPGIVLHALFNLVTCLAVIYSSYTGEIGNNETTALRPASGGATVSSVPGF
jgi:membrane protease YdiL (CAAX protease family)